MKNFEAYRDVKDILDKALQTKGGVLTFKTHGDAVRWRQRAYAFRKGWRETSVIASPYERIMFPQIDKNSCEVELKFQETNADFTPKAPVNDLIDITPNEPDAVDLEDALERAKRLMKEEGLDFDRDTDVLP